MIRNCVFSVKLQIVSRRVTSISAGVDTFFSRVGNKVGEKNARIAGKIRANRDFFYLP